MATKTFGRDEIGEIVSAATLTGVDADNQLVLGESLFECERENAPFICGIAGKVDRKLLKRYPVLDLDSIFSLLHPKRFGGIPAPRFMPYHPGFPGRWEIDVDIRGFWANVSGTPGLWSPAVKANYEIRVFESQHWWQSRRSVQLSCCFAGLVPSLVRQAIRRSQEHFDEVVIVQEVPVSNAVVRDADPLVVGLKNGVAYLIDRFDTTTFEEYVAREFSQDATR